MGKGKHQLSSQRKTTYQLPGSNDKIRKKVSLKMQHFVLNYIVVSTKIKYATELFLSAINLMYNCTKLCSEHDKH